MSYATDFHLLDDHGSTRGGGIHRQLKQNLATSVAFHLLVLLVFVSIRTNPIHDRPLASYQIELVDLSEQKASPPPPAQTSAKKTKSVPVAKKPKSVPVAVPQPVETPPPPPVPQERLAETFAGALNQVAVPDARPIPPPPTNTPSSSQTPVPAPSSAQDQPLNLQAPPDMPRLATRERPSPGTSAQSPSSPKSAPLAKSLQQAVESVAIPQTTHRSSESVPTETKAASPKTPEKKQSLSASRNISLPREAPKMAATVPVEKMPERPSVRVKKKPLSEALQQAVQSVVIPDMKVAQVAKPPASAVVPPPKSVQNEQTMPKIVLPPQAPKLATMDSSVPQSNQSIPDPVPQPDRDELGSRIAKLTIPKVDVSQPHEALGGTTSNEVKTKTKLKVSGSSPDGNPYWGRVWAKIDQEWIAPPVNVHQGNVLQVLLEFRLERTGAVKNLTVRQTSGNEYYDLAAKRAVLAAAPLPGFPSDMTERYFTLQFQFTVNER